VVYSYNDVQHEIKDLRTEEEAGLVCDLLASESSVGLPLLYALEPVSLASRNTS
jgi:hypothetical protein